MLSSKVSIVVPIFNAFDFLEKCVDSLVHQTYKNIEILLIDDGSKDESYKLCKKFESSDKRIRAFTKENEGLGLTKNFGIKNAIGDFIIFIDSDDYVDKSYVEKMVRAIENNKLDICLANYKYVYLDKGTISEQQINIVSHGKVTSDVVHNNGRDFYPVSSCMNMYKRNILVDNKIQFLSEREWMSEDIIFNLEYMNYVKKYMIISEVNYYYTQKESSASLTHSYRSDRFEKSKKLYNKLVDLSKRFGYYKKNKNLLANMFFSSIRFCIKQEYYNSDNYYETIKNIINDNEVQNAYKEKSFETIEKSIFDFLIHHKRINMILKIEKIKQRKK